MTEQIKLKKLYEVIKDSFPDYKHSSEDFKDEVISELNEDPIRTRSLRKEIQTEGLKFEIIRDYPLNDFQSAALHYMTKIGINKDKAEEFERKYLTDESLFEKP